MVKIHPDEIKRKLDEQEDEFDGTNILDGSDPDKIGNPSERLEKMIGNEPDPQKKGFSIAEAIEEDEAALAEE
jgi:hypothetical protein